MPWFDRALKSVQGTAEKAAFEADKLVRVHREEGALGELQTKAQAKLAELGQAALALYRSGAVSDPGFAALAKEIDDLEAQVKEQQDKVEAVKNEQYQGAGQPAAPVAAQAPAVATPVTPPAPVAAQAPSVDTAVPPPAPVAAQAPAVVPAPEPAAPPPAVSEEAPAAPALVECPSCHTAVKATAAFCPECGHKMH